MVCKVVCKYGYFGNDSNGCLLELTKAAGNIQVSDVGYFFFLVFMLT